jgi:hypothetical protein
MAESGYLVGWERVTPGMDAMAQELYGEMLNYMRKTHAEGLIESFEPVLLGPHGGQLNGFVLVRGDREKLDIMRNSDSFLALNVRANKVLMGFMVVRANFGLKVAKILSHHATAWS